MNARTELDRMMLADVPDFFSRLIAKPSWETLAVEDHHRRFIASMDQDDLTGEIDGDVAERLIQLIQAQDANGAGRLLVSTMHAWADRLARRQV